MEFNEVKETILSLDDLLPARVKKYMHYRSVKNFVLHFDEIRSESAKGRICALLSDYVEEVRAHEYDFSKRQDTVELAKKYLDPIAGYYKADSNFMKLYALKFVLATGIAGDGFLYMTDLSARIGHWPVVTTGLLLYYLFIVLFKEPKGRVYGFFY